MTATPNDKSVIDFDVAVNSLESMRKGNSRKRLLDLCKSY